MHRRPFLMSLCAVAVVVRLAAGGALLSQGGPWFVLSSDDGDAYDAAARWQAFGTPIVMTDRMSGKWDASTPVEARWPQGYWLFLAAQYRLLGSAYVSALLLQALLGAGGTLAVFALAARVLDEGPARLAAIAQAISSTGVYLSAALFAESLYLPLLLGGLALVALAVEAARAPRTRLLLAGAAGALLGLAEVTRPLALAVLLVAATWAAFEMRASCQRWRVLAALGGGFAAALVPFIVQDIAVLGRVAVLTAGGAEALRDQATHGENLVERTVVMFLTGGWVPLGEPLISSFGGLPTLITRLAVWLLAAIGGIWLLLGRCQTTTRVAWLLAAAAAAVVAPSLLVGLPLVRYRAAADPIFIIWMVAGVQALRAGVR